MACTYKAPNGNNSKLFDKLYEHAKSITADEKEAEKIAVKAWLTTQTTAFKIWGSNVDENNEPSINEEGNFTNAEGNTKSFKDLFSQPEPVKPVPDTDKKIFNKQDNLKDIQEQNSNIILDKINNVYKDIVTGKIFKRLTEFIGESFSHKEQKTPEVIAQNKAEYAFRNKGKFDYENDTITVNEKEYTFNEYKDKLIKDRVTGATIGTAVHAIIEKYVLNSLGKDVSSVDKKLQEIANGVYNESDPIDLTSFDWLTDNIKRIFRKLDLNFFEENVAAADKDKMLPEAIVHSPIMGIATTIDGLIEHFNGDLSIIDWKSGNRFLDDATAAKLLAYGSQYIDINDSQLSRAKMEIMLRAIMIKELNPDARFRKLSVVHLTKAKVLRGLIDPLEVETDSYLSAIEAYFKNENPEVYQALQEKGLFDPLKYGGVKKSIADDAELANLPTEQIINRKRKRLSELIAQAPPTPNGFSKETTRGAEILSLTEELLDLEKEQGENLQTTTEDIGWFKAWFGNLNDIDNRWVQMFRRVFFKAQDAYRKELDYYLDKHRALFGEVLREYFEQNGDKAALKQVTLGGINLLSYTDLFSFMWANGDTQADTGLYRNQITQDDVNNGKYSQAQYDYWKFFTESIDLETKEVGNSIAFTNQNGKPVTKLQAAGKELPGKDSMPRVPMKLDEFNERYSLLSKKGAEFIFESQLSNYLDLEYYGQNTDMVGIPFKYLGNSNIIAEQNHTLNTEIIFKAYMTNLLKKKHLDDVYSFGQGLVSLLKITKIGDQSEYFTRAADFLQNQIFLQILDEKKPTKFMRKTVRVEYKGKTYKVDSDKILDAMKNFVSASAMWLKPVAAAFNTAMILIFNHKEALKGSIAKDLKSLGIEPDDLDFSLQDMIYADAEYVKYMFESMLKPDNENKVLMMANKLRYLPDNYDYAIRKSDLLSAKNKFLDSANLYFMHGIGEDYGQLTVMIAQLKHMKTKDRLGNEISMWEAYEVQDGELVYTGAVRGKTTQGDTLDGISALEAEKLRRVGQRLHGGYRAEERTAIELYALGRWLIQFKKYMPSILNNLYQNRFQDDSLGKYILDPDLTKKNGEDTYVWLKRVNEGRVWVFMKYLANLLHIKNNPTYKWDQMKAEDKLAVIESLTSLSLYMLMMFSYGFLFDDDDEKDPWAIRYRRLAEDITQGYYPPDIIKSLQTPTTVVPKLYKYSSALSDFMWEGVIQGDRNQSGTLVGQKEVFKNTPFLSTLYELNRYFYDDDALIQLKAR